MSQAEYGGDYTDPSAEVGQSYSVGGAAGPGGGPAQLSGLGKSQSQVLKEVISSRVPLEAFKISGSQARQILARASLLQNDEYLNPTKVAAQAGNFQGLDDDTAKRQALLYMLTLPSSSREQVAPGLSKAMNDVEMKIRALAYRPPSLSGPTNAPATDSNMNAQLSAMGMTEKQLLNELNWPIASLGLGVPHLEDLLATERDLNDVEANLLSRATASQEQTGQPDVGGLASLIHSITSNDRSMIDDMKSKILAAKTPAEIQALQWQYSAAKAAIASGAGQELTDAISTAGVGGLQFLAQTGPSADTLANIASRQAIAAQQNALEMRKLEISSAEQAITRLTAADKEWTDFVAKGGLAESDARVAAQKQIRTAAANGNLFHSGSMALPGFEQGGIADQLLQKHGFSGGIGSGLTVGDVGTQVDPEADARNVHDVYARAAQTFPRFRDNPLMPAAALGVDVGDQSRQYPDFVPGGSGMPMPPTSNVPTAPTQ